MTNSLLLGMNEFHFGEVFIEAISSNLKTQPFTDLNTIK